MCDIWPDGTCCRVLSGLSASALDTGQLQLQTSSHQSAGALTLKGLEPRLKPLFPFSGVEVPFNIPLKPKGAPFLFLGYSWV